MVAYKVGDNFSILKCHDFAMLSPIREHMGILVFDVRGLYCAMETLGGNRESAITHFRRTFLRVYGPETTDTVFDWTSLVYFSSKLDLATHRHSKDGHPEGCQATVGISQLAKLVGVPMGLTVMLGTRTTGNT